jgi:hypothetical protein
MSVQTRKVIVVNKYWECDPVCWVLTNKYLSDNCGVNLPWPNLVRYPFYGPVPPQMPGQKPFPRLVYTAGTAQIEVWCISDLLIKFPPTADFQSSSQRKMEVLSDVFSYSPLPVTLVVAVGTASSGPFCPPFQGGYQDNINGSVVVGSKVFMHDGHPASDPNPYSAWRCDYFDQLMNSSLDESTVLKSLGTDNLETALLCPPINPATNGQHIYLNFDYVSIGDINVTDYTEYATKDKEAGNAFVTHYPNNTNGDSVETTHGLIYATARTYFGGDPPFMFVSGVVDRFTLFNDDVKPKVYAQNVTGAQNAGVVVAALLSGMIY